MKRCRKNVGGVDRISNMPEPVIHQIMSFLSSKEVAGTSVLSKKWYHFKASYPVLNLKGSVGDDGDVNKFRQLVYNSLRHFSQNKLRLEAFCIEFCSDSLYSDLNSWISLAFENGVKRLYLNLPTIPSWLVGTFPQSLRPLPQLLFSSKTLTVLNLSWCFLDQPLSMFGSLRELSLKFCFIKDRKLILKDDDCPLLEHFVLTYCTNLKSVHISNLHRLCTIDFTITSHFLELVVASPSIQSFAIAMDSARRWSDVVNIDGCDNLKSLLLKTSDTITDTELHSLLSKLALLEELLLFRCCQLKKLKISSPCLKTLHVEDSNGGHLSVIEIATPSLKNFIYVGASKKACRIKVADCYCNLETLVLIDYFATERTFHNLISKFPLLENLWMVRCDKLGRLKLLNPRLKRLHVAPGRCCNLKAVKVDNPNLIEFCYIGLMAPKITVPDFVKASGGLRFECEPSAYSSSRLCKVLGLKSELLTKWVRSSVPGWRGYVLK